MPAKADKKLSKLSDMFLRTVLRAGRGCPRGALYWFTGSLLPANRIIEMKLQLLSHICRLESSTLASMVLTEQQRLAYPGLWSECLKYLRDLGILISEVTTMTKLQFKSRLKSALIEKNRQDLLSIIKT